PWLLSCVPDIAASSALLLLLCRKARRRAHGGEFRLGFFNPLIEALLAYDLNFDRHEGMARPAQFGALAVVLSFFGRTEPGRVDPARDRVDFDAEGRNRPGMDHIRARSD